MKGQGKKWSNQMTFQIYSSFYTNLWQKKYSKHCLSKRNQTKKIRRKFVKKKYKDFTKFSKYECTMNKNK